MNHYFFTAHLLKSNCDNKNEDLVIKILNVRGRLPLSNTPSYIILMYIYILHGRRVGHGNAHSTKRAKLESDFVIYRDGTRVVLLRKILVTTKYFGP